MKKEKKKYTKPVVKKNDPLMNVTFATVVVAPATAVPGTGGTPAPAIG